MAGDGQRQGRVTRRPGATKLITVGAAPVLARPARVGYDARACAGGDFSKGRAMNYRDVITIEPGKRGGRPTVRGMRIAVSDVLGWLAAGMTHEQIIADHPELTEADIRACLAYAADRERRFVTAAK